MTDAVASVWTDALLAAAMLALDPVGMGGVLVRARAGPVRDRWLAHVDRLLAPDTPRRRIAAGISEARLSGGLDIGATLALGRPTLQQGVLAAADGGVVVLAMAERLAPAAAGVIGMA
ncbi:MAG: magnesium chelatase ATPase subunit D, partial [Mesorhizobium sp.]|nr:magnesium chelatase ATPase subunit D [Mesorhizobium sp.]